MRRLGTARHRTLDVQRVGVSELVIQPRHRLVDHEGDRSFVRHTFSLTSAFSLFNG
jgi:hypothetical protein